MIKIFRKIHYGVIEKNASDPQTGNTGKYLKYAIGEVVLVVIGILIALNLNNWNASQKKSNQEIAILKSLQDDLLLAKRQIITKISHEQEIKSSLLFLLNFDTKNTELKRRTNLDSIFYIGLWNMSMDIPVISTFSNLKNTGEISLINNKDLRKKFTSLEVSLGKLKERTTDRVSVHQIRIDNIAENDVNFVILANQSIPKLNIKDEIPNDYCLILNNPRIRNLLTIKLSITGGLIVDNTDLSAKINDLMTEIELELSMLK
jgi:hypothetical protein